MIRNKSYKRRAAKERQLFRKLQYANYQKTLTERGDGPLSYKRWNHLPGV